MSPKVSIVMPVYNEQRYLPIALESIANQTFSDFELLVTQNGSTDNSPSILAEWSQKDPRIKVHVIDVNRGYLPALNGGLDRAQGEYIARMDGDDICHHQRLEKQVEFLDSRPDFTAVGCNIENIDADGDSYGVHELPHSNDDITKSLLSGNCGICHPASMFRRSAVRVTGGYLEDMRGVEDQDLWLRLGEHGKIANLPEVLLQYRVHSGNISYEQETHAQDVLQRMLIRAHERRGLEAPRLSKKPPSSTTAFDRQLHWAWTAIHSGNQGTARKHARRLLWSKPLSRSAWVLAAYAFLGNHAEKLRRPRSG